METIIQYLNTLITVLYTSYINTGNRVLDNVIIGILSLLCINIIKNISNDWREYYNSIVFYLYGMKYQPLDIWKAPYIYNLTYTSKDNFFKNHKSIYIGFLQGIYSTDLSINWCVYITQILKPLVEKTRMTALVDDNGRIIRNESNEWLQYYIYPREYGLYIIAIDKYGSPIYYGTNGYIYFKYRDSYLEIDPYFTSYYKEEYYKIKNDVNVSNGIYVMKFVKNDYNLEGKLKKIGEISSKKTFDTLFYTQKDELLTVLDRFKNGSMYPSHIPIDNKIGILLYGPPGTGKTGTISAISNYLKRNITMINITEITTVDEFEKILDPARYKETVFVLDEFDCILDVLYKNTQTKEEKDDWSSILLAAEGEERKQILEMIRTGKKTQRQNLNMAYLLQKLDGLESSEGRIIIATTNNPDCINPSLLRPGRFDIKLCLGNCTQDMYCQILENYFKDEKNIRKRILNANIPDLKYSPLEIINMAIQCNTLNELLKKISSHYN
jgi:DNA replication protein DnaC